MTKMLQSGSEMTIIKIFDLTPLIIMAMSTLFTCLDRQIFLAGMTVENKGKLILTGMYIYYSVRKVSNLIFFFTRTWWFSMKCACMRRL